MSDIDSQMNACMYRDECRAMATKIKELETFINKSCDEFGCLDPSNCICKGEPSD